MAKETRKRARRLSPKQLRLAGNWLEAAAQNDPNLTIDKARKGVKEAHGFTASFRQLLKIAKDNEITLATRGRRRRTRTKTDAESQHLSRRERYLARQIWHNRRAIQELFKHLRMPLPPFMKPEDLANLKEMAKGLLPTGGPPPEQPEDLLTPLDSAEELEEFSNEPVGAGGFA